MLHYVALVRTDVLEELSASYIRVTRIGELGTLAVTSNQRTLWRNTATWRNIPEDAILRSHRRENLKSYTQQSAGQIWDLTMHWIISMNTNVSFNNLMYKCVGHSLDHMDHLDHLDHLDTHLQHQTSLP
jgi:hypothetical protein